MIRVANRNTYAGPGVPITRPNVLGNPYVIGKDGTREQVIQYYREFLWNVLKFNPESDVGRAMHELARRHLQGESIVLICCCTPEPCHGQVIAGAVEWLVKKMKSNIDGM